MADCSADSTASDDAKGKSVFAEIAHQELALEGDATGRNLDSIELTDTVPFHLARNSHGFYCRRTFRLRHWHHLRCSRLPGH